MRSSLWLVVVVTVPREGAGLQQVQLSPANWLAPRGSWDSFNSHACCDSLGKKRE